MWNSLRGYSQKGGMRMGVFDDALKAFFEGVLSVLRYFFKDKEWWTKVEQAVVIAILLAELDKEDGEEKKNEVIEKIMALLEDLGYVAKGWAWLYKMAIGFAIDLIIEFVNDNYGHDWFQQMQNKIKA